MTSYIISNRLRNEFGRPLLSVVVALAFVVVGGGSAFAETSTRDVEVAARAVAFLASRPSGEQGAAIIYDPSNPQSVSDADALKAILEKGVKAGKVTLASPRLVSIDALNELAGSSVAFVTEGLGASHGDIASSAASQQVLTISSDLECARSGHCVVGVQSQPSVEILISKSASEATSQRFAPAFLMMAKEV